MKKYLCLLLFSCFWGGVCYSQTPQKTTYTYDALNRLTEVLYANGAKVMYNYDVLGNRTSVVVSGTNCLAATATLSGTQTINAGQPANLSVSFTGAAPYTLVMNGQTYSGVTSSPHIIPVSPTSTTTYTLTSVSNACGAGTVSGSAVVTVNSGCTPPQPPPISSTTITSGQTATLTASGCSGTVNWYSIASGGSSLGSGTSFTTPTLTATTTYYASCTVGNCVSATRGSGTVTVIPVSSNEVYSVKTGSWHDPTTWNCNCIPNNAHTVEIKQNHTITVSSGDANLKNLKYSGGGLNFQNARKLCFGCNSSDLTVGLVAYFPFNGNANDASVNSNNGIPSGATLTNDRKTGNSNGAYNFGGYNNSSYIQVPNSNSLQFTSGFTFSLWYSLNTYTGMDGYGNSASQGYHILFAKEADWGGFYAGLSGNTALDSVYYNITNKTNYSTTNFNANASVKGTATNLNTWVHMSYVVENGTAKIFRNGVLIKITVPEEK